MDGVVELLSPVDLVARDKPGILLVPSLGVGHGPPTGIMGQGYVGKTIISMDLGLAVATEKPLWGLYGVRKGQVLHLDYEQGARITGKRLRRMCAARGLPVGELEGLWHTAVFPRVNLTSDGAEAVFCKLFENKALVIVDSLKGATPGVDENNSAIRDKIQVLTRASEKTGATVLLIHHAGKTGDGRARKEAGRGSSAIFDELQSAFVVTGDKGCPALVSHEKDRERGELLPDFYLQIEDMPVDDDPKGGLGVKHLEPDQVKRARSYTFFDGVKSDLVEIIRTNRLTQKEAVLARCNMGSVGVRVQAWAELIRDGVIEHNGAFFVVNRGR